MSDGITIHNYDSGDEPEGQTWDTRQLQEDFEVLGFAMGCVAVRRKSDGVRGSVQFKHSPRVYFDWVSDADLFPPAARN